MQVAPQNYPSMLRCFHLTIAQDGFTSLWRGAFPAFVGAIGENAMAFGVNGYLKRLQLEQYMHPLVTPYVNGFITGIQATVLCVIVCRSLRSAGAVSIRCHQMPHANGPNSIRDVYNCYYYE